MGRGEGGRQSEKCSNWKIARQLKILRSEVVAIAIAIVVFIVVGPNVSQVRHEVRARKFFTAWQHPLTPLLLHPLPLPRFLALSVAAVLPPSTCCGAARSECDNLADKMLTR